MAIALKLNTATGRMARLAAGDALDIDTIEPRSGGDLIIGATLGAGDELKLALSGENTRVLGSLIVDEDLIVSGTTTSVDTENVLVQDNHLYLNSGYETEAAQTGGLVVNNLPTGTNDSVAATGFTAGSGMTGPTVITSGSGTFAQNDIIQITGADDPSNNGLFEVEDHTGTTLEIRGVSGTAAVEDFTQNQFVTDTTVSGTIRKVTVSVLRAGTDGVWETASGAVTGFSFTDLGVGTDTLQSAYGAGNTIVVTTANGAVAISNSADVTDTLQLSRTFVGAGDALQITMGPGNEAVTGRGLDLSSGTGATGTMAFINNLGSGNALQVQDGSTDVLVVSATGGLAFTGQVASSFSALTGNLSFDAIAAELVLDDVGNSGLTLSQSSDRTLSQTGAGEVLNGVTSVIGGFNALAEAIDIEGRGPIKDYVIVDGVTITAGDVVSQGTVTGRATQGNANSDTQAEFIGIALETGTGDTMGTVSVRVALPGGFVAISGASFTAGDALFMPDGTGQPTDTAPSGVGDVVLRVGWAHSATEFVIDPGPAVIL